MDTPLLTSDDAADSSSAGDAAGAGETAVRSEAAGPVVARLRILLDRAIAAGTLGTGAKIPTERALCGELQASRSAVRTALAELEREGRITRHVGRGTFLAELGADLTVPSAGTSLQTSPAEIMATRLVLEPEIAALAARHAVQSDLDHITHCLRRGNSTDTYDEFEAWDSALHRGIAAAAHNGLLLRLFDAMNAARDLPVWGSIKRRSATPERRRSYEDCHGDVVAALIDRDPDAAREQMRHHLLDVRTNLLGVH